MSNSIFDNEVLPYNYTVYRNDRSSRGGGILLAICNSICSKLISAPTDLELLSVELSSLQLHLCVVYIPPNCSQDYHSNLLSYLCSFVTKYSNFIILGDFNFPDINWSSLVGSSFLSNMFCDFVFQFNLVQHVSQSTHIHGNTLDLVLSESWVKTVMEVHPLM